MLTRTDVEPFLRERDGELSVELLDLPDDRILRFLDRLLRLARRLEGRPRAVVREALRRQERRVRDARRLSGINRTLLTAARFRPQPGAERAEEVRAELFRSRGQLWPPVPGDERVPYETAALTLGLPAADVDRLLYADDPEALILVRAPRLTPKALLRRYNLDLARGVLLDAVTLTVRARGGWKDLFRAVKLARLMYRLEPEGDRSYRLVLTGPAAPFVTRPRRYGSRFARIVPALTRAPGWSLEATVEKNGRRLGYRLDRTSGIGPRRGRRARYDSGWEEDLAREFADKIGAEREGWTLHREDVPVQLGEELFLPDFTMRHDDGRIALVELIGFWTPEYLNEKLRKLRRAGIEHLVLVVFRGLAAHRAEGSDSYEDALDSIPGEVVWFVKRVRIGPVMDAVERVARRMD